MRQPEVLSYLSRDSHGLYPRENLNVAWSRVSQRWQDQVAVVEAWSGREWTYGQLAKQMKAIMAAFVADGLRPSDPVAILSTNCIEWLCTAGAALSMGLVVVGLDPEADEATTSYVIDVSGARYVVACLAYGEHRYVDIIENIRDWMPDLKVVYHDEKDSWRNFLRRGAQVSEQYLTEIVDQLNAEAPAFIHFTSGRTGKPKGVVHTSRGLQQAAVDVTYTLQVQQQDVLLLCHHLHHSLGLASTVMVSFGAGATLVIPSPLPDPVAAVNVIDQYQVTLMQCTADQLARLTHNVDQHRQQLASIRDGIIWGAEAVPHRQNATDWPRLRRAYGLAEATGYLTLSAATAPAQATNPYAEVSSHLDLKIVDYEGSTTKLGVAGEICVRGPQVMLRYCQKTGPSHTMLDEDEWLHTSDRGVMQDNGLVAVLDRLTASATIRGKRVCSFDIDDMLVRHPEVGLAQTVFPQTQTGPCIVTFVTWQQAEFSRDTQHLHDYLADRLAEFLLPELIFAIEKMPLTEDGKVAVDRLLGIAEQQLIYNYPPKH